MALVIAADIPATVGVYAFYRDGQAIYVGKATRCARDFGDAISAPVSP
ncbi:MAG: hypothetical protein WKF65_08715 [Gaiellaceae bacterium]